MSYRVEDCKREEVSARLLACRDRVKQLCERYGITSYVFGLLIETDQEGNCDMTHGLHGDLDHIQELIAQQVQRFTDYIGE